MDEQFIRWYSVRYGWPRKRDVYAAGFSLWKWALSKQYNRTGNPADNTYPRRIKQKNL
jgi:hypothetical protein